MKKFVAIVLCMLTLLAFTACSAPIYPGLPDISEDPIKGIEIYCWEDGGEWKCGGTVGTNRQKFDEEIRALQVVTIPQLLQNRGGISHRGGGIRGIL